MKRFGCRLLFLTAGLLCVLSQDVSAAQRQAGDFGESMAVVMERLYQMALPGLLLMKTGDAHGFSRKDLLRFAEWVPFNKTPKNGVKIIYVNQPNLLKAAIEENSAEIKAAFEAIAGFIDGGRCAINPASSTRRVCWLVCDEGSRQASSMKAISI